MTYSILPVVTRAEKAIPILVVSGHSACCLLRFELFDGAKGESSPRKKKGSSKRNEELAV